MPSSTKALFCVGNNIIVIIIIIIIVICLLIKSIQMVQVIWHKAASPTHTDGSFVFARWCQCALPSNTCFLWSVGLSVTVVSPSKPLKMPFGLWTRVGRRKHEFSHDCQVAPMCPHGRVPMCPHRRVPVSPDGRAPVSPDGRAHWRHLVNCPSVVAMRSYVKLLWPLVFIIATVHRLSSRGRWLSWRWKGLRTITTTTEHYLGKLTVWHVPDVMWCVLYSTGFNCNSTHPLSRQIVNLQTSSKVSSLPVRFCRRHPVPAPHIRSTILALYKLVCMYVCMYVRMLRTVNEQKAKCWYFAWC